MAFRIKENVSEAHLELVSSLIVLCIKHQLCRLIKLHVVDICYSCSNPAVLSE
jgi:hypothetical protein